MPPRWAAGRAGFDSVDEVRQSDLRLRSRDPDGPDEQTHPILLLGEDMLDARTDFRFGVISAPDRFRHRAPLRPLTMDMADEAVPLHELLVGSRSVSGVRPDAARRVGLVEKSIAQTAALIGGGVRRAPFTNEAETAIERDVVLIAEDRNRHIDGRHRAILRRARPMAHRTYPVPRRRKRGFRVGSGVISLRPGPQT